MLTAENNTMAGSEKLRPAESYHENQWSARPARIEQKLGLLQVLTSSVLPAACLVHHIVFPRKNSYEYGEADDLQNHGGKLPVE
jgi:hypothetical protein